MEISIETTRKSFYYFTKKLGQQHIVYNNPAYPDFGSTSKTLCGMPLLGNNYTADYEKRAPEKIKPCAECRQVVVKALEKLVEKYENKKET